MFPKHINHTWFLLPCFIMQDETKPDVVKLSLADSQLAR